MINITILIANIEIAALNMVCHCMLDVASYF